MTPRFVFAEPIEFIAFYSTLPEVPVLYRCFGNHYAFVVMIVSTGTMTEQVEFLLSHLETKFIPTEVEMEGSIVILPACFGVFLEHRH